MKRFLLIGGPHDGKEIGHLDFVHRYSDETGMYRRRMDGDEKNSQGQIIWRWEHSKQEVVAS